MRHGVTKENDDLDKFSGTWTKEEADEFDAALAEQRKVHPKDWQDVRSSGAVLD